ncbi:hypothetical protein [Mesorhizobium sp. BE184]|uniref:hypothetical protein n=1 Tax=Mesorhizobium sp. BE184 TaxID=2817714 RepID=UPI00285C2EBB|nr:hypothetical protein [Mesorhizobium sp. BE184]MDR7031927.1 hypothetical protein [Mesorhizobium sp. BE184]
MPPSGIISHVKRALPSLRTAVSGAIVWALTMGASALAHLITGEWETVERIRYLALLYAAGGAIAFPIALFAARLLSLGRRDEVAFAAAFVCLSLGTIATTSALFALQYRVYYAEWHAPAFSVIWIYQLVFTTLAALYQFAVLGLRFFFPVAFIALFLASAWFVRQPR